MALQFDINLTEIDDADTTTNWDGFRWTGTGQFAGVVQDLQVKFEGTAANAVKAAGNSWKTGLGFDWYTSTAGGTKTANTVVDMTATGNELLGTIIQMLTPAVMLTRAAGGLFMWVSSSTETTGAPTDYSEWWIGGSDVGTNGWKQVLIDTRKAPSFTAGTGTAVNISSGSTSTNEITTTASHGFWTGQTVVIASSDIATAGNTPAVPTINRADWEIRVTGATTFVIVNDDGTDVILSSAGTTVGTVTPEGADLTAVRRFGVGVRNVATVANVKAENTFMDICFNGFPIYEVTDDAIGGATTATWEDFINHSEGANNGLIEQASGAVLFGSAIRFGSDTQSNPLTFLDTIPYSIIFKRYLYYGGANRASVLHLLNYEDIYFIDAQGASGQTTSVEMGVLVGTGDDRKGVNGPRFLTEDPGNQTYTVDFATDIAHLSSVNFYGAEFVGAREGISFDDSTKTTLIDTTFITNGKIDVGTTSNGAELFGGTLIDPNDRTNDQNIGLLWPGTTTNISDMTIVSTGDPSTQTMIEFAAAGTYTFDNIKFFGEFPPMTNDVRQILNSTTATVIDSYGYLNADNDIIFHNGTTRGVGQEFTGTGVVVDALQVLLKKTGAPTGNMVCKIYDSDDATHPNAEPTGAILATSNEIDVSKLGTGSNAVQFLFEDGFVPTNTQTYFWVIEVPATGGDVSNNITMRYDGSSSSHAGNAVTWDGTTYVAQPVDVPFLLTSGGKVIINLTNGSNADVNESLGIDTYPIPVAPGAIDINSSTVISFTGLKTGSEVRILQTGTNTEIDGIESSGTTFNHTYEASGATNIDVVILHEDWNYEFIDDLPRPATDSSIPIQQRTDRIFNDPTGV